MKHSYSKPQFRAIMGNELALTDLYVGPHRGPQSKRLGIEDAPNDPKQTKLRCFRCLNIFTTKTTPFVVQQTPLILKPKWLCYCADITTAVDPCTSCPVCSRDDSFTRRRVHLCPNMTAVNEFTPVLLPVRMMLDYQKCEPGCVRCGFSLDHIVCECP